MHRQAIRNLLAAVLAVMLFTSATPARAFWIFGGGDQPASSTIESTLAPQADATPESTDAPAAATVAERTSEDSAVLRVRLLSLEQPQALGLTLDGSYSVESDGGFRFARGTAVSVAADGDRVLLSCGGLTIDMGASVAFTRHAIDEGQPNGLYIHESLRDALYTGDLYLSAKDGRLDPVLYIDVEDYLYGVVPYEMSDSFPIEALKAQAVAARTYALNRRENAGTRPYDVVDTTADQVFRGYNPDYTNVIEAVDATRGVVGMYKGKYATCYFSASNGGQTALPSQLWGYSGDYGYLDVRDDPYDVENPSSVVKSLEIPADGEALPVGIAAALKAGVAEQLAALGCSEEIGDIGIVSVLGIEPCDAKHGEGNRMYTRLKVTLQVRAKQFTPIEDEQSSATVQSEVKVLQQPLSAYLDIYGDLKKNYNLKINSADCEITSVQTHQDENGTITGFTVQTRRFGHGVGMSQRGAQWMAGEYDRNWLEILAFYYPNMELVRMDYAREPLQALEDLPDSVGYARARPTPQPTPAPLPALKEGEYYARVALDSRGSTLNVRETPGTEGRIVAVLSYDQRLIVVEETGEGWAHIKTAEVSGYVSLDYIKPET